MSSSEAEAIDAGSSDGNGTRKRRLLIVMAGLVIAIGLASWFTFERSSTNAEPSDGDILVLAPLTATTGNDALRHARVSLGVVSTKGTDIEALEGKVPLLKDALLEEISAMDADYLRSESGSRRLRERLTGAAHDIWGTEKARRVILTELLIQ